jgi:hypothetical protein
MSDVGRDVAHAAMTDERLNLPSASGMDRLAHCPGSFSAERGLPPLPEQPVTADGVRIHDAMHSGDDSELEPTPKEIKTKLSALEAEAFTQWLDDFSPGPLTTADSQREKRLWIRNKKTLEPIASAQLDFFSVALTSNHAILMDYKTGFRDTTPSERNYQLRAQVVALKSEYPELEHIRAGIAASRLASKLDLTDYDANDIAMIDRQIRFLLWTADQPDAQRVPGSWCRYCKANGVCREAATYALLPSTRGTILPDGKPDQMAVIEAVGRLTPQELAFIHERRNIADTVFDSVEAQLKTLPADQLREVGLKLVDGNRNKEIVNVPAAFERLGQVLTEEERMKCVKIARGPAADLLAEKKGITKKSAVELLNTTLGNAMIEKIGNPKLKPL